MTSAFAQERYRPGGSIYFRGDVTQRMRQRDVMWEKIDDAIHLKAQGNHANNLILRLQLYEYCRKTAQHIIDTEGIQTNKPGKYDDYVFIQTRLYEDLQPTISKVRSVLDDQNVTFATIQAHLQSNDPDIQYFYQTLAVRYDDAQTLNPIATIQSSLQAYYLANRQYPATLDDLIESRFIKRAVLREADNLIYTPHNHPYISLIQLDAVQTYTPAFARYVLLAPVSHLPNANVPSRDAESMQLRSRTSSFSSRTKQKKTPPTSVEPGDLLRKIYTSSAPL